MTETKWIRISAEEDIETVLAPALEGVEFNRCSGPGHRDKTGRLLTTVGFQDASLPLAPRVTVVGITYPNKPKLQQKVISWLEDYYARITGGHALLVWVPKAIPHRSDKE